MRSYLIGCCLVLSGSSLFAQNQLKGTWEVYPNDQGNINFATQDTVQLIPADSLELNPSLTITFKEKNRIDYSISGSNFPTKKGVVTSHVLPQRDTMVSVSYDTVVTDSGTIVTKYELKEVPQMMILGPPAMAGIAYYKSTRKNQINFVHKIALSFSDKAYLYGKYTYQYRKRKLLLIKKKE